MLLWISASYFILQTKKNVSRVFRFRGDINNQSLNMNIIICMVKLDLFISLYCLVTVLCWSCISMSYTAIF